jgi:hypothetical protein
MGAPGRILRGPSLAATAGLAVLLGWGAQKLSAQNAKHGRHHRPPIVIEKQGSFYYGGGTITAPGTFEPTQPFGDNSGESRQKGGRRYTLTRSS